MYSSAVRQSKMRARSTASSATGFEGRPLTETRQEVLRKEALEEMFAVSRSRFLKVAYSVLRNKEDAEDAVQDAFLSAHRNLRSFEGRAALTTWLTRIVLNAALMMRRKRKPFEVKLLSETENSHHDQWLESIPDAQPNPETIHAEREALRLVEGILGKIKPVLRQAFTMTYVDELSGSEACDKLDVSFGTFKARLFRARKQVLARAERALEKVPLRLEHSIITSG